MIFSLVVSGATASLKLQHIKPFLRWIRGNDNSTTRFRRYRGEYYGVADDKVKPLLKEYTDASHLLVPNQWYQIRIKVEKGITTYSVNGEELFRYVLTGGEGDGHFGLRLLQNHVLFTDFKVTTL